MTEIKQNEDAVETRLVDETKARPEELVFYYSRERRLAKAPPAVRALYEKQPARRFGLFRSLTDTRPKAMLFTSIVFMCLVILLVTFVLPDGPKATLAGNAVELTAMRYEGATFIVLQKTVREAASAYAGIVDINVYPQNGQDDRLAQAAQKQLVFTEEATEEFRFSVPFESPRLRVFLQAGEGTASFTVLTR